MRKNIFLKFILLLLLIRLDGNLFSQSKLFFDDVVQYIKLGRVSNDTIPFDRNESLPDNLLIDFGNSLNKIKVVKHPLYNPQEIQLFDDVDGTYISDPIRIMSRIIYQEDSVFVEHINSIGETFSVLTAGIIDSTWFFNSVKAIEFKEDWEFDLNKFTCDIKTKMFMPCVNLKYKDDFGPIGFFWIKPLKEASSKKLLVDTIVTDVFLKQTIISWENFEANNSNTKLDDYRTYTLIYSIIDKLKNGELKAYEPNTNFKKKISKSRIKELFAEEFVPNRFETFPVSYKNYAYRFKLVERWYYDEKSLNFKKEALGIILLKKNEPYDYIRDDGYFLNYTFTKIAYIPFKNKKND